MLIGLAPKATIGNQSSFGSYMTKAFLNEICKRYRSFDILKGASDGLLGLGPIVTKCYEALDN